jgi:N6-adenosine-specific RNA methylase IME4
VVTVKKRTKSRKTPPELTTLEEIKKALFPLREEELATLEASVLAEGIRDPLVVWPRGNKSILVDGHCRYRLAQKHNLPFRVVEKHFANLEEALAWVDQNQLARRNLTDEQRRYLLGRIYERQKKAHGGDRKSSGQFDHLKTAKAVADQIGVGEKTIRRSAEFSRALDAVKQVSPEAAEKILKGEVKDAITVLPQVAKDPDLLSAVAEKIAKGERSIRKAKTEAGRKLAKRKAPELPKDKYNVILADPPWEYGFAVSNSRRVENKYPTMKLEDICSLKIPAADDSILFLWVPSPKLPDGLCVLKKWGFEYKTCMVWVKDKIGMGYYTRNRHELVLIGTKGKMRPPEPECRPDSVITAPRGEHSSKPGELYKIIERMYPEGRYLELFARGARPGWMVWGDEVSQS